MEYLQKENVHETKKKVKRKLLLLERYIYVLNMVDQIFQNQMVSIQKKRRHITERNTDLHFTPLCFIRSVCTDGGPYTHGKDGAEHKEAAHRHGGSDFPGEKGRSSLITEKDNKLLMVSLLCHVCIHT